MHLILSNSLQHSRLDCRALQHQYWRAELQAFALNLQVEPQQVSPGQTQSFGKDLKEDRQHVTLVKVIAATSQTH